MKAVEIWEALWRPCLRFDSPGFRSAAQPALSSAAQERGLGIYLSLASLCHSEHREESVRWFTLYRCFVPQQKYSRLIKVFCPLIAARLLLFS